VPSCCCVDYLVVIVIVIVIYTFVAPRFAAARLRWLVAPFVTVVVTVTFQFIGYVACCRFPRWLRCVALLFARLLVIVTPLLLLDLVGDVGVGTGCWLVCYVVVVGSAVWLFWLLFGYGWVVVRYTLRWTGLRTLPVTVLPSPGCLPSCHCHTLVVGWLLLPTRF